MKKTTLHKRQGKVTLNGVKPEPHELDIILFYTEMGKNVEVIPASHTPGNKRPDFIIDGIEWEAKSPTNESRSANERIFYRASCQSDNVIIDLRHLKSNSCALALFEKCFKGTRRVRRMHIITKTGQLRVYKK